MQSFYKICLVLMIVGGINWGLVGLFQFDFVGWLLGGSASIWSRIVFTLVGVAAVCGIPGLFGDDETGERPRPPDKAKRLSCRQECGAKAFFVSYRALMPAGNDGTNKSRYLRLPCRPKRMARKPVCFIKRYPTRSSAAIKPTLTDRWVPCRRFRASSSSLHGRPMTGRSAIHRRTPSSR